MNQRGFILPNPYFLLAAGITLAVSFGAGYWRGWSSGMEKYYAFKSDVETQQEAVRMENDRKLAAMAVVQRRTEDGWRTAIDELQRNRIRVQPVRCPGVMPTIPAAVERPDAAPVESGLGSTISVTECEGRVNNAANDAAHVIWLQHWIKQQHEASK
jgi:hypothetical protein